MSKNNQDTKNLKTEVEVQDPQRRKLLCGMGKIAYVAPALTLLSIGSANAQQNMSTPPPPPPLSGKRKRRPGG